MMDTRYKAINKESEIINKINGLEMNARLIFPETQNLYYEDFYFMSIIDKSIKLIDSFLFALKKRNITVLATLTRVQIDCVLRAYATTLVKESHDFCKAVLFDNIRVNQIKDADNVQLSDRHLCESLGDKLDLSLYDLYQGVSGYIHFSASSFQNITKSDGKQGFSMFISRNNRIDEEETFEKLSMELANHFYYFGRILIEVLYASWLEQKKNFEKAK